MIHCVLCAFFSIRRQLKKHSAEHDVTYRPMTARVSTRCSAIAEIPRCRVR